MQTIGDEPYQMKQKYPHIHMAVDTDRRRGIAKLLQPSISPATDVVLLDDAYQHRYVHTGINILLIDYNRIITKDCLLPAGRLREPVSGKDRADIVIVTKCPEDITPIERLGIERELELKYRQKIFFTKLRYPADMPQFSQSPLLVTGIAAPQKMADDLAGIYPDLELLAFPDHHMFTKSDIETIKEKAGSRPIITTEKDATRLTAIPHTAIPIEVEFLDGTDEQFNKIILDYVHKNSRNSRIH